MLHSHFTQNCIFLYFLDVKNPCFEMKHCSKSSYTCAFILHKKQHNCFYKNLHNSGIVGRRKLPDPSLNGILMLSIGVQCTLQFQWTNFGLKCLIYIIYIMYIYMYTYIYMFTNIYIYILDKFLYIYACVFMCVCVTVRNEKRKFWYF